MDSRASERQVVFIVDDDASVCRALERLLCSYGLRSRSFGSASELLAAGSWREAGCFLIDVRMPRMNGFELADRLAAAGAGAPVIFMSAHAEAGDRESQAAGAVTLLRKPFDDPELIAVLRQAVGLPSSPDGPAG